MTHEEYMQEALIEAQKAAEMGEVPIGAVIVLEGKIIARAHNEMESRKDATAHAEILAIQRASEVVGNWRLTGASLIVTLEPCPMCSGAIRLSRISELIYGCADPVQGAVGSKWRLFDPSDLQVTAGILSDVSRATLQSFFRARRTE